MFCRSAEGLPDLTGSSTPVTTEILGKLYPDRSAYLARLESAVRAGVDRGFLLPRDA